MEDTGTPTTTIGNAEAALALADSSPATPAAEPSATESTAPAATTQAVQDPQAPDAVSTEDPAKGEPPKWRWQDILANARETTEKETAARVKQEIEAQYADFKETTPEERAGLKVWNQALKGDPHALAMVAQVNPALAQAISGKTPESKPEAEPQPDAAIQMPDGSTVPTYTAEGLRAWQVWNQKQMESSLSEKFKPLAQTAEKLRVQEQEAARQQQTQTWAAEVLGRVKRLPHFETFKPEISKALAAVPANFTGNLEDVVIDTYTQLLTAKLEQSTKEASSKALTDIQQRALAATGNPASAATATPPKVLGDALAALKHADAQLNAQ